MNVGDRVIIKGENPKSVYEIKHIYPNARTYHYPTHDIAVLVEVGKCAWTAIPKEELELAEKPKLTLEEKLRDLHKNPDPHRCSFTSCYRRLAQSARRHTMTESQQQIAQNFLERVLLLEEKITARVKWLKG